MKKFKSLPVVLMILLFSIVSTKNFGQSCGCDYNVTPSSLGEEGYYNNSNLQPGDVICLSGNFTNSIKFKYIQGTSSNPIRIVNDGQVNITPTDNYGIRFLDCNFFELDGSCIQEHGIKIDLTEAETDAIGIDLSQDSSDIDNCHDYTIKNIEIVGDSYLNNERQGILCARLINCNHPETFGLITNGNCNSGLDFSNIIFDSLLIHNIGGDALAIGNHNWDMEICESCSIDHVNTQNVEVSNCVFDSIGQFGVRLYRAFGNNSIHDNIISRFCMDTETQGVTAGIFLGYNSKNVDVYNNTIQLGKGDAIVCEGAGNISVFNNHIIKNGVLVTEDNNTKENIKFQISK